MGGNIVSLTKTDKCNVYSIYEQEYAVQNQLQNLLSYASNNFMTICADTNPVAGIMWLSKKD